MLKLLSFYFSIICSAGFLLSFNERVSATTYYVSPEGSDTSLGSADAPFQSIQKAADIVSPGDTVIVKDGIYTDTNGDNIIVWLKRGGNSMINWITFKSENKWGAVLDGKNNATGYGWSFDSDANYVRVEYFEIKGCRAGGFWSNAGAHHVYIYGNHIHHMGRICTDTELGQGLGAFQGRGTSFHTYDSNVIHDNGRYANGENGCMNATHYWQNHDHGLYLCGSNTLILNNIFYNHKAGWSICSGCYESVNSDKIINNVFAFQNPNRQGHILIHAYGEGNFSTIIQNNIFYKPMEYAIRRYGPSNVINMVVKNNLVYGAKLIEDQDGYVNLIVKNNIEGQDPLFVDPVNYDFHLQSNSPAINSGTDDVIHLAYDHDGNRRMQGFGYDIGAYEYISKGLE